MHERVRSILVDLATPYSEHLHRDMPVSIGSPSDFAAALGYEVGRITKTLLLRAIEHPQVYCLAVLSSDKRMNMDTVASILRVKRVQMASRQELSEALGYPPTGVSPIGAGQFPVLMDERLMGFRTILIGSGEVGAEIEMLPQQVKKITRAAILSLSV